MVGLLACAKRSAPPQRETAPPQASTPVPPPKAAGPLPAVSALLDVQAEKEATVVAFIEGSVWKDASVAGRAPLEALLKRGAPYRLFPTGASGSAPVVDGALSGKLREQCGAFYAELAGPVANQGYAAVSTVRSADVIAAIPLEPAKIEPRDATAVAAVIRGAAGIKIVPKIERAFRVDLDGDGQPETLFQTTHPDLLGDPPKYKRQYYSLVVVGPGGEGEPAFAGYLQASREFAQFEVLTIDSVADVDRDGKRELLVRARHAEGWQTQVFGYDGKKLIERFRSASGERDCGAGAGE